MKLKSMKNKLIAGAVAVVVISGGTAAYANTDAGAGLREWYTGLFNQKTEQISNDLNAYTDEQIAGLTTEYEKVKAETAINIDLSRELATGESLEEIVKAKLEHIESLDATEQEILENIGLEFYNVFLDGYFEIVRLGDEGLNYATNDLQEYTSGLGNDAVGQLTSDLNGAQDEAVLELEEAIKQAQEQLIIELDNNEEITTRNLKNQVNWKIEELRSKVTTLLTGLVQKQEAIIIAKAQELEDAAKAAMDDVVSNINK